MEAVEVDTLQGVGDDFLLHHAKYVPVQSIRCPGAFPRDPDMQYQRHVWAGKSQHTPQCTVLYSEGLSTFAEVQSHLAQGSHGRGVHQPGQAIKIAITKVTGMHRVYSNSRNPSLGELQIGVAEDPPHQVDLLPRGGCRTLRQEFLDPCAGVQSKPPEIPLQMHMGIHCIRYQNLRFYPDSTILFPTPPATD